MIPSDQLYLKSQHLEYIRDLGHGTYGMVFLVYSKKYRQQFALKRISAKKFNAGEVDSMATVDSPYVTRLYDYKEIDGYVYLLMEFCPYSIQDMLKTTGQISVVDTLRFAYGLIQGLAICHEKLISHGDIKPSNFLVDDFNRPKICDFGLARQHAENENSSTFDGSFAFMAPEVIRRVPFNPFKADIWSLGVSLYWMCTGTLPWQTRTIRYITQEILNGTYNLSLVPHQLTELIRACMRYSPDDRMTAQELLKLKCFSNMSSGKSIIFKRRSFEIVHPRIQQKVPIRKAFSNIDKY